MAMWELYESFDPEAQVLYLDLIAKPAAAPRHPGLSEPKLLETFKEAGVARQFTDGYLHALSYDAHHAVREVRCGEHRAGGCNGPGKPCYLGLDAFHCNFRERH